MPLDVWRSTRKYPTNGLCARGFARELKLALVGEMPDYPRVERAFRDATGADLGRATWHGWWHGTRLPNATYRTIVDNTFTDMATRWLFRSLKHDRLQAHLAVLDLKWVADESPEEARAEAWEVLVSMHGEWSPAPSGKLSIPSALEIPGAVRRETENVRPIRPAFGRAKGAPAPLAKPASELAVGAHEPLNPASILRFLMYYAFESRLPDPGLKEAFVLDFLSVVAAATGLVEITAPERRDNWGQPGRICSSMQAHFWPNAEDERIGLETLYMATIEPVLSSMPHSRSDAAARQLLLELKTAYDESVGTTGVETKEFRSFVSSNQYRAWDWQTPFLKLRP